MGKWWHDWESIGSWNTFTYTTSTTWARPFTDAGSPSSGNWKIIVNPGVVISGRVLDSYPFPSMRIDQFPALLWLVNYGEIRGRGGNGVLGFAINDPFAKGGAAIYHEAPGGGGAGTPPGFGQESNGGGSAYSMPGTATTGGAGGWGSDILDVPQNTHNHQSTPPQYGADAIELQHSAKYALLENHGLVWGGGGGGYYAGTEGGNRGGDPGESGRPGFPQGYHQNQSSGGYAVFSPFGASNLPKYRGDWDTNVKGFRVGIDGPL